MPSLKRKHKYYFIYKILNLINKKSYVGFHATNYEFSEDKYYGSSQLLNKAIKKYGKNNFIIGIIEYIDPKEWKEKEQYWIKEMKSHVNNGGYNLTNGGNGVLGLKLKKYQKQKISKALKGRYINKSWDERYGVETSTKMKENLVKRNKLLIGKTCSKETKTKISNSSLGKPKSNETKIKIGNSSRGKSWEERYGIETAIQLRKNRQLKCAKSLVNI